MEKLIEAVNVSYIYQTVSEDEGALGDERLIS